MQGLIRNGRADAKLAVGEVDEPNPGPDEVLVDVRGSTLNRGELALLEVRPDGWRPGQDVAGVVCQAAANGSGPAVGARVVGLADGGAWAERVAVPVRRLVEIPDTVSFEHAATLGLAGLTALRAVRLGGPLLGRTVLVLGAAGGLGHLLVQLAAVAGARVTAFVRTASQAPELVDLGAVEVVTGTEPAEAGFDAVFDGIGGASLERAVRSVRPGGTVVLLGATDPEPARVTLLDFIGREGARILTYFSYAADEGETRADLDVLVQLVAQGRLRPVVGAAVDWREPERLVAALAGREVTGKVVLRFGSA